MVSSSRVRWVEVRRRTLASLVALLVLLQGCSLTTNGGGGHLQLSGIAADPPAEPRSGLAALEDYSVSSIPLIPPEVRAVKRVALLLFAGLVLVTACSNKAKDHNAQDVSFAQGMIPHHQQAVEMSNMALSQASSAKVKDLAIRIKAAQGPEIEQMKGWLSGWSEPVEAKSGGGMGGMNHGGGSSSDMAGLGMMTDAQMKELGAVRGAEFDRMFLTMMIGHHEGAITMARAEIDKGKHAPAKQLAQAIVDAQQKEISEMQGLTGSI